MGTQLPSPKVAQPPIFGQYPLWPNGWIDQDATWYGGKHQPGQRCVRWGRSIQFLVDVYRGQTAGWMKTPLGREVDLDPGHIVLHRDPAPIAKGAQHPPLYGPCLLWQQSPISATAELLFKLHVNRVLMHIVKYRDSLPWAIDTPTGRGTFGVVWSIEEHCKA